jgi:glycosyltransferase involved in cell wall biosynthesis
VRGFVISWFYPPINSSEGLVTFKLLNRSAVSHDVFTQKDDSSWSYNSSENKLTNPKIKTIFGNGNSLDEWVQSCVEYFDKHHEEYDFIMSRSMPPESHIAALEIKKKYPDIKWIASFGDPIYNSPYSEIASPEPFFPGPLVRFPHPLYFASLTKRRLRRLLWRYENRANRRLETKKKYLERDTLLSADSIIFNNPYERDFMLARHELDTSDRHIILPHSYEKKFYPNDRHGSEKPQSPLTFVHIGHLDFIRTPLNFLKAIRRLKKHRPELYKNMSLNFYGTLDNLSKIYMVDHDLVEVVRVRGSVTYFESLSIMQRSDYCLLVDANISSESEKNIYFAAKLADYIGSGTPILALSMTDGASADITRKTGNILTSHSVDEIYMTLVMLLEHRLQGTTEKSNVKEYDASNIAKKYDKLVSTLINSN